MPDKKVIHTETSTPKETTANVGNDSVQKAKDEAVIAKANQDAEFARQNVKDLNELKEQQKKLVADQQALSHEREMWEKQKEKWLIEFEDEKEKGESSKTAEVEKIRKVKEYYESKKATIDELEQAQIAREEALTEKQKSLDSQERRIESLLQGLDERVELKKRQIDELQIIIDDKAPRFHKLFNHMLSEGEQKRDWNYNIARGDVWHNFTERISIIYHSLYEMLFG